MIELISYHRNIKRFLCKALLFLFITTSAIKSDANISTAGIVSIQFHIEHESLFEMHVSPMSFP